MSDTIIIRGEAVIKALEKQDVRPTIIIGIGGSGGDILLRIRKRFFEKYGSLDNIPIVSYLWLDTDTTEKEVGAGKFAEQIRFKPNEKLMTIVEDTTRITNDLNQHPHVKKWFYPGLTKLKTMTEGAGQIRAYSRLGFFEHYETIKNALSQAQSRVLNTENERIVRERLHLTMDPESRLQVFIVFSIAGGTGSGMFLDLAFLAKTAFPGTVPTTIGYLLMPGLFNQTEEKVFANGYAALKELEHYSYENDFQVEWANGEPARPIPGPPFTYTYLIDRMNQSNTTVDFSTREIVFNMIAENIFKDFAQGDFSAYKRGVRVNLDQYLVDKFAFRHLNERQESIIEQQFITRFSSFGMASITVPADRIEQACAYKLAAEVVDQWGSLSNSGFHAAGLTKDVTDKLLPAIHMKEGSVSVQGVMEQRHDLLNTLSDDGQGQGQKLQNQVRLSVSQTCREVNENVHKQKGQGLAQYLRAAVERETAKLRFDPQADPQQWGDYSRAIHFNKKEKYVPDLKKALFGEVRRVINEQHQSVGYAVALLRQTVVVLRDELHEYLPAFEKQIDQSIKRVEEGRRRIEALLATIGRHELRSNWDGRKKTILRYDIQLFEEISAAYLNAIVSQQVYLAAKDTCEQVIDYIGVEYRREDGALHADEGLIGQLYNLGKDLEDLKDDLESSSKHFRERSTNELSLMLYDPEDIEDVYLPQYLKTGEIKAQNIRKIGDQILLKLKTSVVDLPGLIREQGKEKVLNQIRDMAREPFEKIKEEFDVLETLWKKYPKADMRELEVRAVFNRAKFWLNGGGAPRSYKLAPERQKILIGLPPSADVRKLDEFKRMIKEKIQGSGGVEPSIQQVPDRSEIIFYSEVGGIPINWSNQIAELRMKYLRKQGEGDELHTDAEEVKFNDLVILNDQERAQLEEAHKCFLLGLIFGEIKPELDASGRIRYLWSERIGLANQFRSLSLGIEMRAIAELVSKEATRSKLLGRAAQHLNRIYRESNDHDLLARFNALLQWYFREVYPENKIQGNDGGEYSERSNMCRAVTKQIEAIEKLISAQENANAGTVDKFIKLTDRYLADLDTISNRLVDNKRSLKLEAADPVPLQTGAV
jgi:hypothetical protein